jgi:Xaa-Pro aminopeptidase
VFERRFQSFADVGGPTHGAARVAELRHVLEAEGLDGFVVPRADEHQNEYVPANAERLLWLTGFAGSAGVAVVLKDRAALFVDGRYTEQAKAQVDRSVFEILHVTDEPPTDWLSRVLRKGERVGYDPLLHTPDSVRRLSSACEAVGAMLAATAGNPVDAIWRDRPGSPMGAVTPHKTRFAGETTGAKLARVREALKRNDGLLISDPHNLAWLFNIRGADVSHTPLPLGYAYLPREGRPVLLIDSAKLSASARDALAEHAVLAEPNALVALVERLGGQGARVLFDGATAPALLTQTLERAGGKADVGADPIGPMKAAKNKAELAGARAAHERDGAALVRFLAWFDAEAPRGRLTEIDAVEALESFRRATGALKDISFPTLAAAGPNSAMPHYRVSVASNRRIDHGVFLIDSGAQYEDGTTDVTRTIAVGRPTALMRDRFTRVLKGHIAIAEAVFPRGTSGAQIDVLARKALWDVGLDFDHGTGHGVGSYLSVHEGPQRIAKTGTAALAPGMILSNEPGYYSAGDFGIRTENLMVVEPREIAAGERAMLGFETLTLAPIDLRLVNWKLLDGPEMRWLDVYHARVRKALSPLVDTATRRWLNDATRRRLKSKAAPAAGRL